MGIESIVAFGAVLFVACASPGPTIAALVARVLGRGIAGAPAFCLGLLISDIVWLTGAVLGLAVLAETFHTLFVALKYLGAGYLLYLAWKLWTASAGPVTAAPVKGEGRRLFFAGIAVGSGNPKTMLFYLALLPTLLPLQAIGGLGLPDADRDPGRRLRCHPGRLRRPRLPRPARLHQLARDEGCQPRDRHRHGRRRRRGRGEILTPYFTPPQCGGRRCAHGRAISSIAARRSRSLSAHQRPISWKPMGRPAPFQPLGIEIAGWPVRLKA